MRAFWIIVTLLASLSFLHCREDNSDGDGDSDSDTDGDGDVDGDGDADGDGEMPCHPALGVCDPIFQCGCSRGQYCDVTLSQETLQTAEVCLDETGGSGEHGDEGCSPGTCAPGNFCRNSVDAEGAEITVCRAWCIDELHCADYPGSHCTDTLAYQLPDGSIVEISPYKTCSAEDVSLGAGTADFTICRGRAENCPGNPPHEFTIGGGEVNGRCSFSGTDPMSLTFMLRDEVQSISITGNDIVFSPGSDFVAAEAGERARFSIFIEDDTFSTTNITSPAETDACEVMIRYVEDGDELGFEMQFTCDHIDVTRTGETLTTLDGEEMGPGIVSMSGCALETGG